MQTRHFISMPLVIGAIFSAHGSVWAQVPAAPPAPPVAPTTIVLCYKFKPGRVTRYKVTQDVEKRAVYIPPNLPPKTTKIHLETRTLTTDLAVRASDGAGTTKNEVDNYLQTTDGNVHQLTKSEKAQIETAETSMILPNGRVPTDQFDASLLQSKQIDFNTLNTIVSRESLPYNPVKVGDIWTNTDTAMGFAWTMRCKLVAVKVISGRTTADISQLISMHGVIAMPADDSTVEFNMQINENGVIQFDLDAGEVASGAMNMQITTIVTPTQSNTGHRHSAAPLWSVHIKATVHSVTKRLT